MLVEDGDPRLRDSVGNDLTKEWGEALLGAAYQLVIQAIDTLVIREWLDNPESRGKHPCDLREKAIGQLEAALLVERRRLPEKKVRRLVERWERETLIRSDPATDHPVYQELVAMGGVAVQPILHILRERSSKAFEALHDITGECPWTEEDRGDLPKMIHAWLIWGRDHGYL
jgi:hypothetical protein